MLLYALRRLIYLIPVAFGVSLLVFALVHLAPGDAISAIADHRSNSRGEPGTSQTVTVTTNGPKFGPSPGRHVLWALAAPAMTAMRRAAAQAVPPAMSTSEHG